MGTVRKVNMIGEYRREKIGILVLCFDFLSVQDLSPAGKENAFI